jgi:hypothetical protein
MKFSQSRNRNDSGRNQVNQQVSPLYTFQLVRIANEQQPAAALQSTDEARREPAAHH